MEPKLQNASSQSTQGKDDASSFGSEAKKNYEEGQNGDEEEETQRILISSGQNSKPGHLAPFSNMDHARPKASEADLEPTLILSKADISSPIMDSAALYIVSQSSIALSHPLSAAKCM
ncbi:hypothetical protein [Dictyobacter kobayashii]|uniref:Uncharacterized protein n=1 Tax=Dictyobacter kobayashii TaxID=2014872 RepID=A0A402APR7_9CHLR|nr:hypothetical protein [Dictyobacter kobayashii]GCE20980.1 hypothetical protein KDK_47800 [Dictyobacter kobayashii]